jgi:hypothetical protein
MLDVIASDTGSANSSVRGLPALTLCLERDPAYRLAVGGPSSSITIRGEFAIWERTSET